MRAFEKIAILGGGAFGVALAKIASEQAEQVMIWARDEQVCKHINQFHKHPTKLSFVTLSNRVEASHNLEKALKDASYVIITLPMMAFEQVLAQVKYYIKKSTIIISTTKGITNSLELPYNIIQRIFSPEISARACYLSGPSFAKELAQGLPTALTLASGNRATALEFQHGFSQVNLRLYYSDDIISVCVGGALKNVIAIAAGASFGLGLGRNALASLITRGLLEISRLATRMGGKSKTLMGLSGMGDLVLSCTDPMSRNYSLGLLLAQGYSLDKALAQIGSVVEGANTARSVADLSKKYQVDMPISLAVFQVLYEQVGAKEAMRDLLSRVLKDEFI